MKKLSVSELGQRKITEVSGGQLQGELNLTDCPEGAIKQREDRVNRGLAEMEW